MSRSYSRTAGTSCNIVPASRGRENRCAATLNVYFNILWPKVSHKPGIYSYSTQILQYCCSAYSLFYTARAFGTCAAINATEILAVNGQRDVSQQMEVWHLHLWPSVPALCIKNNCFPTSTARLCLIRLISQLKVFFSYSVHFILCLGYWSSPIQDNSISLSQGHGAFLEWYGKPTFPRSCGKPDLFLLRWWFWAFSFL